MHWNLLFLLLLFFGIAKTDTDPIIRTSLVSCTITFALSCYLCVAECQNSSDYLHLIFSFPFNLPTFPILKWDDRDIMCTHGRNYVIHLHLWSYLVPWHMEFHVFIDCFICLCLTFMPSKVFYGAILKCNALKKVDVLAQMKDTSMRLWK